MTLFEILEWRELSKLQKKEALKLSELASTGKNDSINPRHLNAGRLVYFPYTGFALLLDGKPVSFVSASAGNKRLVIQSIASSGEGLAKFREISRLATGAARTPAEELFLTALHWGAKHYCETLAFTMLTKKGARALQLVRKRGIIGPDNEIVREKLPKPLGFHR